MSTTLTAHPPALPDFWPCRWDWCRATFPARDALIEHIKHHTSAAPPLTRAALRVIERMEASQEYTHAEASFLNSSTTSHAASSQTQPSTQPSAAGNTSVDLALSGYGTQPQPQSQSQTELPVSGQVTHTPTSSYYNEPSDKPSRESGMAALEDIFRPKETKPLPASPSLDEIIRGNARILEDSQSENDRSSSAKRTRRGSATPQTTSSSQRRSTRIGSRQSSVEPASKPTGSSSSRKRGRSQDVDVAPTAKRSAASMQLASIAEQETAASQGDPPFEPQATSTQYQPSQDLAKYKPTPDSWQPISQMPVDLDDLGSQAMDLGTQDVSSSLASDRYDDNAGYGQQV